MKMFTSLLIFFSFLAIFADSVVCIGHNAVGKANVTAFVKAIDSNTSDNQNDFFPSDHCKINPNNCSIIWVFVNNLNNKIFYSSLFVNKISFIYNGLELNTFLINSERPPAFA